MNYDAGRYHKLELVRAGGGQCDFELKNKFYEGSRGGGRLGESPMEPINIPIVSGLGTARVVIAESRISLTGAASDRCVRVGRND